MSSSYFSSSSITGTGWWQKMRQSPFTALVVVSYSVFIDFFSYSMVIPFLSIQAKENLKCTEFESAFLFAAFALGSIVFSPIFGILSDKIGRRVPMLFGIAGLGFSSMYFVFAESYTEFVVARVAQGIASAACHTIGPALLADLYPADQLTSALGVQFSMGGFGFIIGPAIGGFMHDRYGYESVFILAFILTILDFCGRLIVAEPRDYMKPSHSLLSAEEHPLASGMDSSSSSSGMWKIITSVPILACSVALTATFASITFVEVSFPVWAKETFHLTSSEIGVLFTAMSIAETVISIFSGSLGDKISKRYLIAFGIVAESICLPLLIVPRSQEIVYVVFVIVGSTFGIGGPNLSSYAMELGEHIAPGNNGLVMSLYGMFFSLAMFIGPLFTGLLTSITYFQVLVILGGVELLAAIGFLLATRHCPDDSHARYMQRKVEQMDRQNGRLTINSEYDDIDRVAERDMIRVF